MYMTLGPASEFNSPAAMPCRSTYGIRGLVPLHGYSHRYNIMANKAYFMWVNQLFTRDDGETHVCVMFNGRN